MQAKRHEPRRYKLSESYRRQRKKLRRLTVALGKIHSSLDVSSLVF
jgi:hypothetical protein